MREIRNNIKDANVFDKFDRVVFESIVKKVIVGSILEDGTIEPYKLTDSSNPKAYSEMTKGVTYIESDRRKENGEAHQCKLEVKIFDRDDFLYKEYFVYQPLQRRGVIDSASIEALRASTYFTANSNLFNEADFEDLEQTNPRDSKAEKKYQKYIRGRQFAADVIAALSDHVSDKVYMDYAKFEAVIKKIIKDIDGYSDSRLTGIAMEMSVMDKTAVIQKNRKGEVIVDPTTKDTEIIALSQDPEEYMKAEVYPHVPDAIWRYEFDENKAPSAINRERLGAEFPFSIGILVFIFL